MVISTLDNQSIILVGTSHIASQSISQIEEAINIYHPKVICVELDRQRLQALLTNQKPDLSPRMIRQVGFKGYLFAVVGSWIQRRLGRLVNMQPGQEMRFAAEFALKNKLRLALIDQPITTTLSRFSQSFTWRERFRIVGDLVFGPFQKQERVKLRLDQVPDPAIVEKLTSLLRNRYPSIYKVFITERNQFMAKAIRHLRATQESPLLVVVGEGHRSGLEDLLTRSQETASNK